jgi:hypothetical protein
MSTLDPASTTGVPSDPELTAGDIPSCAYSVQLSGREVDVLVFIGMSGSYESTIVDGLATDGFTAGASAPLSQGSAVTGTEQAFSNGISRIAVEKLVINGTNLLAVVG